MTSVRVDFEGQYGGFCCCAQQPIQIARTKPAPLEGLMSDIFWNNFCDRVDEALHPLNKLRKVTGFVTCVCFAAFIAVPLAVMIPTMTNLDSVQEPPNVLAFIIGPMIIMACLIFIQCIVAKKANLTMEKIKRVCDDVSTKQPRLSFHIRFERHYYRSHDSTSSQTTNYIEVIVVGVSSDDVPLAMVYEPAIPSAPYMGTPGIEYSPPSAGISNPGKSPAERLASLEEMKPHLSGAEYLAKREEILASV
mmetsp:Transcript_33067/g.98378  ORF Transcript_33067/g.98378 Transcript_33067/m.98378 type:complete len:249 (-) Transcript_33067:365-1111(-)